MNIVHITTTDPAGSVINFVEAINRWTPNRARAIFTNRIPEYDFKTDIGDIMDAGDELVATVQQADVVHMHKVTEDFILDIPSPTQPRKFSVKALMKPSAKVIYHIHGHPYERANVKENAAEYHAHAGKVILASTPDLVAMYKPEHLGTRYFPNCVPIHDVRYLPRSTNDKVLMSNGDRRFIVVQTPTDQILKDVRHVSEIVAKLGKSFPVIYLKVSMTTQDNALRHKRNGHIVFDHMQGYYGLSSLEGLSMGKPTLAGLSDITIKAICDFFCISPASLPWQITRRPQELEYCILDLIHNEQYMKELGIESRQFMENVWSDAVIAKSLVEIYGTL